MNSQPIDSNSYDKSKWIKVVCRLCGTEWLYPKQYESLFDAKHPLENCAYCKRNPMLNLRNI
jgi:hypothetical protein